MGLIDRFKKKFESAGSEKKVQHVVDEKKSKKAKKNKKESKGGLTSEEIRQAQALETQQKSGAKDKEDGKSKEKEKKIERKDTKHAHRILVRVVVTEKATYASSQNQYVFEVVRKATKPEIRKAVKAVYNVEPTSVNIISVRGKHITFGRVQGVTKKTKKAIVTLPKGATLPIYEK